MGTPPRETHNVPRRTNDRESGEYVTDPGRKGDVVIATHDPFVMDGCDQLLNLDEGA